MALVMVIGAVGASLLNVLTSKHHIPTDNVRFLMTGSLSLSLLFIGLVEMILERNTNELLNVKLSIGLKFLAASLIVFLGFFGHQLHAFSLLGLIFSILLIPMSYGAYVWFWQDMNSLVEREIKE